MRNTGKVAEKKFKALAKSWGFYLLRLIDVSEVYARNNGTFITIDPQPSDFIMVSKNGETSFVEIKSMAKEGPFSLSRLSKFQRVTAKRITDLGGNYFIYLYVIPNNRWYKIPYKIFLDAEKKTLTLEELKNYALP